MSSRNTSGDLAVDLLSEGVRLQVAGRLAVLVPNVRIVAPVDPSSKFSAGNQLSEAGRSAPGPVYVIQLTWRSTPQQIQTDVDLIRAQDRMQIWSGSITRERGDPLQAEADLAREIASQVVRFFPGREPAEPGTPVPQTAKPQ